MVTEKHHFGQAAAFNEPGSIQNVWRSEAVAQNVLHGSASFVTTWPLSQIFLQHDNQRTEYLAVTSLQGWNFLI